MVRHGETAWSAAGRHTSFTDLPLTPVGRRQARRLRRPLDRHGFALVLSSPRRRALETAELAGLGDRLETDGDLREWEYGEYEGLDIDEIHERDPGWTIWRGVTPGGESPDQVESRARRLLARCERAPGDVLLVGHGHLLRAFVAVALGLGPQGGELFALEPATVGILGWEHARRVVRRWNAD